jgi:hypothetical protein
MWHSPTGLKVGASQYGNKDLVSNTEPGWDEKVDLSHLNGIGKNPNLCC